MYCSKIEIEIKISCEKLFVKKKEVLTFAPSDFNILKYVECFHKMLQHSWKNVNV